jgi:hypothetical protein
MISKYLFASVFVLSAATAHADDNIDWFFHPDTGNLAYEVLGKERIIRSVLKNGEVNTGMAIPTSAKTLVTAAHVLVSRKIGDETLVANKLDQVDAKSSWSRAVITGLWPERDTAEVTLVDSEIPVEELPAICQSMPSPGTPVIAIRSVLSDAGYLDHPVLYSSTITRLTVMPNVSADVDAELKPDNYPISKFAGQPRVVGTLYAEPGASGGALWDTKRQCVAGIVSAVVWAHFLQDREKTMKMAGNPPVLSLLTAVPVQYGLGLPR